MCVRKRTFKVAVAGFHIESVSFLPVSSTYDNFEKVAVRGSAIIEQMRGTNTVIGGFIDICEAEDVEMVPIVLASLGALGPVTDEVIFRYSGEIANTIKVSAQELDGVLLYLHGASWAPSFADPERSIIDGVRAAIGNDKPIVVAMDYHGNIDEATIASATAAFSYRRSPHTDTGETGRRAARCLVRTLRKEISPVCAVVKPKVLVPSIFSATALRPLADIIHFAEEFEARSPHYMDVSVMAGFSYGDSHNTGFSVLCVTDADKALATATATDIASRIWREREKIYRPFAVYSVDDAVSYVQKQLDVEGSTGRPYILLEHADRMNDSTYVLSALLDKGVQRVAVPFLWDNESARRAHTAGIGAMVTLRLGAHSSGKAGPKLEVNARVVWTGEKKFSVSGSYMQGTPVDLGITALLDINGISVSVVSSFCFAVDGDPFYIFGMRPEDFDIIVLRSKTHFRHFYEPISRAILIVDTPDYGPANLAHLPYERLDKNSVYPFV